MGPPESNVACVTTQLSSLSLTPAEATAAGGPANHASLAADFLQEGTQGGDENAGPNPRLGEANHITSAHHRLRILCVLVPSSSV